MSARALVERLHATGALTVPPEDLKALVEEHDAASPVEPVYRYRAECLRVIDGDTFIAAVDLGFGPEKGKPGVTIPLRVRVHGVDTPEVSKPWDKAPDGQGKAAAGFAFLTLMYAPLLIQSYKDDRSFERWVCDVWVAGESYADLLRQAGHVKG